MQRGGKTFGLSLRSASPPAVAPAGLASALLSATPPSDICAPALSSSSSAGLSPCHSLVLPRRMRPLPSSAGAGSTCTRLRRRPAMAPGACGGLRGPAGACGGLRGRRGGGRGRSGWAGGRRSGPPLLGTPTPPSPRVLGRYILHPLLPCLDSVHVSIDS